MISQKGSLLAAPFQYLCTRFRDEAAVGPRLSRFMSALKWELPRTRKIRLNGCPRLRKSLALSSVSHAKRA